jgi:hypothetical protein
LVRAAVLVRAVNVLKPIAAIGVVMVGDIAVGAVSAAHAHRRGHRFKRAYDLLRTLFAAVVVAIDEDNLRRSGEGRPHVHDFTVVGSEALREGLHRIGIDERAGEIASHLRAKVPAVLIHRKRHDPNEQDRSRDYQTRTRRKTCVHRR